MAVQKLLLAKTEVTYGTDPTPDNTNAIETINLESNRYEGDRVERDVDRQTLGGKQSINTNPMSSFSFGVGLAGSGTAGTAPAWGPLMTACGFDETIVASTSVAYELAATAGDLAAADSVAIYDYRPGINLLQHSLGNRGSCSIEMSRGELPRINYNFMGSYLRPVDGSTVPTITWDNWLEELPFTNGNMTTLTLNGESACTEAFSIDFGQTVGRRNLPGCQQTIISDYTVTGTFTIVAPDFSTKEWLEDIEAHAGITEMVFDMEFGGTAGNIVSLDSSQVQITNLSEGETAEGDLSYTFDLSFLDRPILTLT
jgi:hypothetical protein